MQKVIDLVKKDFFKHNIQFELQIIDDITITCIENELKHVILNIINNAKDASIENHIKNPKIFIKTRINENNHKEILIRDNAGGIPKDSIEHIFKPHFTTKEEGKGTGIGLYMSKQIMEKIGATISVSNSFDGALFRLEFP